jgi:D-glycero-D-manno-heptose 1,7-bisphosphate phosphatase
MIQYAAREFGLDLSKSFMVGDKMTDIEVGQNAKLKASILVRTGDGKKVESDLKPGQAALIADSLLEAANWILAQGT